VQLNAFSVELLLHDELGVGCADELGYRVVRGRRRAVAQLREETPEQLDVRLLWLVPPFTVRTLFSSRISGLYSVQQTRLRSEQTLNSVAASGWKHANTPFSRIEMRRSAVSFLWGFKAHPSG
jgi:hypothetical protein